jgi:hypothetical protein
MGKRGQVLEEEITSAKNGGTDTAVSVGYEDPLASGLYLPVSEEGSRI